MGLLLENNLSFGVQPLTPTATLKIDGSSCLAPGFIRRRPNHGMYRESEREMYVYVYI